MVIGLHFVVLMLKLAELDKGLAKSTAHGFAKTTGRSLRTYINSYVSFCQDYGLYLFNGEVLQARRYLQHLSRTHKSIQSMKNYVGGARSLFEIMGFQPPPWEDYLYQLTVQGITRQKNHVVKKALPITPQLLVDIYPYVNTQQVFELVVWTGTLLGF